MCRPCNRLAWMGEGVRAGAEEGYEERLECTWSCPYPSYNPIGTEAGESEESEVE
jgi:hypothetical protein